MVVGIELLLVYCIYYSIKICSRALQSSLSSVLYVNTTVNRDFVSFMGNFISGSIQKNLCKPLKLNCVDINLAPSV